jgi:deazaflavin-dependent oxidoreductase (nitroreductase family)
MADFNSGVIDEFRANGGRVGGPFEGAPLLLLTSIGAKSGAARTTPLMYLADGERIVIFASKAGAPSNPAWYHNLVANRSATVEVGGDVFDVDVSVAEGEERERLYNQQAELTPQFADYAQKTKRRIPVVVLERAADE